MAFRGAERLRVFVACATGLGQTLRPRTFRYSRTVQCSTVVGALMLSGLRPQVFSLVHFSNQVARPSFNVDSTTVAVWAQAYSAELLPLLIIEAHPQPVFLSFYTLVGRLRKPRNRNSTLYLRPTLPIEFFLSDIAFLVFATRL